MRTRNHLRFLVLLLVLAMVAAACSGSDEADTEGGTTDGGTEAAAGEGQEGAADPEFIASTYIGEPENLLPTSNNESEGNAVLSGLFTMLVDYDPETVEPVNAVAESIDTEDNQTFTVTLKDGWTFHNGDPVTAESFVNAWNYGAYGPNAQQNAAFYDDIAGFEDLQCGTVTEDVTDEETGETTEEEVPDCEAQPPAAEELSGLTVNSDTEFTIELSQPQSFFVTRLGYPAYAPLPDVFFDDPDAFNDAPVGNGPLMMDGEWQRNQVINTVAYPDYAGDQPMQIGGVEFRIFDDVNTAVNELLAGNLDIVDSVPPERVEEVRNAVANFDESPQSSITYMGMPLYTDQFGGDENQPLRQALSQAIDREAINEAIFDGNRQPANNFLSPTIPGYQETVEGCDAWNYDPEAAQAAYEEHGGIDGTFTVYFNAGAGHEDWIQAVVNQWSNVLGIDPNQVQFESFQFAEYLQRLDEQQIDGPFRLGWGMDYPHPQNFLQFILGGEDFLPANGGANNTAYISEEFVSTVDEALSQTDLEASLPLWQEAVSIACNDVPLIPIYYLQNQYGWTESVSDVFVDAFGNVQYVDLTAGA